MYRTENFTKFTSASEALHEFKKTVDYRKIYPLLPRTYDSYCRKAYKGGWTYVKKSIQGKLIDKEVVVYDINSMYPSVMLNSFLPSGKPILKKDIPEITKDNYIIAKVQLKLDLKKGFLPTLQSKDTKTVSMLGIKKTDYITTTGGDFYTFYLTNFDLLQVFEHYDYEAVFISYMQFEKKKGVFNEYIHKYKELKENAKTGAEKSKAKIMLNSLYGKFGSKIESRQKLLHLENGINKFTYGDIEEVDPNYIPLAIFITSIARFNIITDAQKNYDNFLYADTDSLHLINNKKISLPQDANKFGFWKKEGIFKKAKYLRAKLYIEEDYNGIIDVKGAGMTNEIKKQINFDNFKFGAKFKGKKATKQTVGGMVIYETEFTIKENDYL